MNPEDDDLIDPDVLEQMAEAMPRKVPIRRYAVAMSVLREKDYSYQEIADWLTEKFGATITRSQVSYVLNTPDIVLDEDEKDERAEDLFDEMESR